MNHQIYFCGKLRTRPPPDLTRYSFQDCPPLHYSCLTFQYVRLVGFEPTRSFRSPDFKSGLATSYNISAIPRLSLGFSNKLLGVASEFSHSLETVPLEGVEPSELPNLNRTTLPICPQRYKKQKTLTIKLGFKYINT